MFSLYCSYSDFSMDEVQLRFVKLRDSKENQKADGFLLYALIMVLR